MLSARRKLLSLVVACVAFAAGLAIFNAMLPAQASQGNGEKTYAYVYSGVKSSSRAFSVASMTPESHVLFGASSLSTPVRLIPQVPVGVFGAHNYGVQLMTIGESYDQSLWHAIAAGAYAPDLANKRVAIIVTPNWFFDEGIDDGVFESRFSYSLYHDFCNNEAISDSSRAYLAERLAQQGIAADVIDAGMRNDPIDWANDFAYVARDDLRLRVGLQKVRQGGFEKADLALTTPNFDAIRAQALVDGQAGSTNNSWSFDNDSWASEVQGHEEQLRDSLSGETLQDTPEYDDFAFFLDICAEAGLEPLVILSPLNGHYYDWAGLDAQTREGCYARIREIAQEHGAALSDYSDFEYEPYFLHDQVHFGWLGWTDANEALYDFFK